jgi:predicted RNA-binding Zn-ribbon protein involved in translation (DUF1610 family)
MECRACGRPYALTLSGSVRAHQAYQADASGRIERVPCPGGGAPPRGVESLPDPPAAERPMTRRRVYRRLLELGMTTTEIAAVFRISHQAVRSTTIDAHRQAAKELARYRAARGGQVHVYTCSVCREQGHKANSPRCGSRRIDT